VLAEKRHVCKCCGGNSKVTHPLGEFMPGIWQRQILEQVDAGKIVILTSPDQSAAKQNAIRRAANRLQEQGKIQISAFNVDGRPRLAAAPLAMKLPEPHIITGLDGKAYRQPAPGPTRF
jgi:hypothetical protein